MAGLFSEAILEQIRAASDIVDVVGSYLPLKRAGANFVAVCPFHKEKTPSFNVNPNRQIFHCFGCHKGGDVFTFVREYENITFPEAVKRLADRAKIPLEFEQTPGGQQTRHLKDQLLQIHEQITQRWQNTLANEAAGEVARGYLAKRGVSDEAIRLFRLGCAQDAWDDTVNWAKSKGHDLAVVEKAGLILRKEGTENYYDRFRGRLIFPICDEQGRVIGFSGRILPGDEKAAKYVNSPETPIFTKGKVFFGLDKSKRAILEAGVAIVCEGQLDLIACFMAGVQNVVAPQGTAFTDQHARTLRRYVDEVVLCFDSDAAGQNAAIRSLDHLLVSGIAVRVAVVPAPHDPDSFIKANGGEGFRRLVEQADGFFDYYLNRLCAINESATDKGRLAILRGMAEAVHKTGNQVFIDKYAQKTALRLGVTPDAVRTEFQKISKARMATAFDSAEVPEEIESPSKPTVQEFWLLKLLLTHEDATAFVAEYLDVLWIQHEAVREIIARWLAAESDSGQPSLAAFLDTCKTAEMKNLVTEVAADPRAIPNPAQQLTDLLTRLRNQFIDRQMVALTQKANQPGLDETAKVTLLRRQHELRQQKRQPLVSRS